MLPSQSAHKKVRGHRGLSVSERVDTADRQHRKICFCLLSVLVASCLPPSLESHRSRIEDKAASEGATIAAIQENK